MGRQDQTLAHALTPVIRRRYHSTAFGFADLAEPEGILVGERP